MKQMFQQANENMPTVNDVANENTKAAVATPVENSTEHTLRTSPKIPLTVYDPPDGGWGWLVTFSAFSIAIIVDGISFTFGILFIELLDYYEESKSLTSWVISVMNGTYLSIGPFTTVLVSLFGCRRIAMIGAMISSFGFFLCTFSPSIQVLIILYGLIGGAGLGLMYVPSIVIVGQYFKDKRALATGIASCGTGVGAFAFAPLIKYLIDIYTWKGAMIIISGICLNGMVAAISFHPPPKTMRPAARKRSDTEGSGKRQTENEPGPDAQQSPKPFKRTGCCGDSILKSPTFLVYGCSVILVSFGNYIVLTYLPDHAASVGLTTSQAAMLISIIGICNIAVRALAGLLADRSCVDTVLMNGVMVVLGGVATCLITYCDTYTLLIVYSVVFGSSLAVFNSLRSIIAVKLMGIERLGSAFGIVSLCQGMAAFVGAPIAGTLTDNTGNYTLTFYLSGAVVVLAGVICLPLNRIAKWENSRAPQSYTLEVSSKSSTRPGSDNHGDNISSTTSDIVSIQQVNEEKLSGRAGPRKKRKNSIAAVAKETRARLDAVAAYTVDNKPRTKYDTSVLITVNKKGRQPSETVVKDRKQATRHTTTVPVKRKAVHKTVHKTLTQTLSNIMGKVDSA